MRKAMNLLLTATLTGSAVFAQEASESVEDILNELAQYETSIPAADVDAMASEADLMGSENASEASGGWFAWNKKEDVEDADADSMGDAVGELNLDAALEESRGLYVAGEFGKAQKGFAAIVKVAPDNQIAQMYLSKILERERRNVEVKGMDAVKDSWSIGMTVRSYDLSDDAIEKMDLEEAEGAVDISVKFPEVDFPEGASAIYKPAMEKIFVCNTRENLAVLESILEALDVAKVATDVEMVEIEAKFVEVTEGTLEELGFQWDFQGAVDMGGGVEFDDGGTGLFGNALRGNPIGSSSSLPFDSSGALPSGRESASFASGTSGDYDTFIMEDTFSDTPSSMTLSYDGGTPFDLLISALDQSSGADVLSAPRIVTTSGEEATIRVGELHYFPEVFETDCTVVSFLEVVYQDFEEKLLGVELSVTPEVDGDQIILGLNPRINRLAGWQNYEILGANQFWTYRTVTVYDYSDDDEPVIGTLPIFRKYEIETEVTIADGSTVGMGGLMSETIESYEDKVPVLGSLPLVGRLFRNEGEQSIKKNLLMFVTARRMEATGRIKTDRSFVED
jgi:type II secretory pathway component GspD/PulD (secretin)